MKHHPASLAMLYSHARTPIGGQFGWGGTLLKRYQQGPKVGSGRSEICR